MLVVQIFNHSRFAHNQVSGYGRDIVVLLCALSDYVVSVMQDNVDRCSIVGLDVSRVCIYLGIWITIMKESGLRRSCDRLEYFRLTAGLGCVEGWGGNEGARVTYGHFMEEIDTHVLWIVISILVGKIVFLIFWICVNNYIQLNIIFNLIKIWDKLVQVFLNYDQTYKETDRQTESISKYIPSLAHTKRV